MTTPQTHLPSGGGADIPHAPDDVADPRALRRALGHFATGVAVVTARGRDGALLGMTMSSFNAVSLDPPLILFSIDRKALSLPAMMEAEGFAVNVLGSHQKHISDRFAKAGTDKWNGIARTEGHHGAPLIGGAIAAFECAGYAHYDGGDHVIFLGRVLRFSADTGAEPLVFFRGAYHALAGQG